MSIDEMMKKLLVAFLFFTALQINAQNLPRLKPDNENNVGRVPLDKKTSDRMQLTDRLLAKFQEVGYDTLKLSKNDRSQLDVCLGKNWTQDEELWQSPYSLEPYGCSWYCGGGNFGVTASSVLSVPSDTLYRPEYADDFDLRTAWVEGAKGDGIGESITFWFSNDSPRVNKIYISNGYSKNDRTWNNNSRVKEFKVLVNNRPYAILEMADSWETQCFEFPGLLGHFPKDQCLSADMDGVSSPVWTLSLQILSVYKGDKYTDTAISDVQFDGVDVHCIAEGSLVLMDDGSTKKIENIRLGDGVKGLKVAGDGMRNNMYSDKVAEIECIEHDNLVRLTAEEISDFWGTTADIILTADHPVYMLRKGWCSFNPKKTIQSYPAFAAVKQYAEGDFVHRFIKDKGDGSVLFPKLDAIKKIQSVEGKMRTYRIVLENCNGLIINGFPIGTECAGKLDDASGVKAE